MVSRAYWGGAVGSTSCDIQPVAPLSDFPHHRSRRTSTRAGLALALPLLCFARVCVGPHNRLYPTRLLLHAVASAAASPTHRSCGAALVVSHHLGGAQHQLQVSCNLVPAGVRYVAASAVTCCQPTTARSRSAYTLRRSVFTSVAVPHHCGRCLLAVPVIFISVDYNTDPEGSAAHRFRWSQSR